MSKKNKRTRVKLIANPGAGKAAEAAKDLKLVLESLEKLGIQADVALAKPKEKATPIARRAVKNGYKTVIAMGGDGTLEAVMRGIVGSKVHLGIIAAGTENNIARSLGIPEDLDAACALIASDKALKLDVGQVRTRKGRKFSFFELATVGLGAALYPDATRAQGGKLSGVKDAFMTLVHQDVRPKMFLTMDDESKIEAETMLVMVSNTPAFGKKFLVAPNASLQDGLLDISVYQNFSKAQLLGYYAKVMDGGYSGDGKVQRYQARKLKVKSSPKLKIMADGVELGKGTVTIKMRRDALRVIMPEKSAPAAKPQKAADAGKSAPVPVIVGNNHPGESKAVLTSQPQAARG